MRGYHSSTRPSYDGLVVERHNPSRRCPYHARVLRHVQSETCRRLDLALSSTLRFRSKIVPPSELGQTSDIRASYDTLDSTSLRDLLCSLGRSLRLLDRFASLRNASCPTTPFRRLLAPFRMQPRHCTLLTNALAVSYLITSLAVSSPHSSSTPRSLRSPRVLTDAPHKSHSSTPPSAARYHPQR